MDDSMDASIFDVDGSSDFEPAPKTKAKATAKAVTKKTTASSAKPKTTKAAAPKKLAQSKLNMTTTKKAVPKKRKSSDSDEENSDMDHDSFNDDSLLSNTPPAKKSKSSTGPKKSSGKALQEIENESFLQSAEKPKPASTTSGDASDRYQKITHIDHILLRPDTYIGSIEFQENEMWVYNSETDAMEYRKVNFVPGLYKIFDEILVNAADNKQNDKNMDEIKVTIDRESGEISVWNNGRGIPIDIHKTEGIYVPELIFGHLLTSSNYKDDQEKVTGGRNGYGAKLANIYSLEFTVETADSRKKQKYKQTWTKNMSVKGKAKITDGYKGEDYTKITFRPDYARFHMEGMDDDFEALVKRRIYDLAGTVKGVKVKLNGETIKIRKFEKYMEMYTKAIQNETGASGEGAEKQTIIIDRPHERWEVGFAVSDGSFKQVSFVNNIATTSGGTHVKYVADQIINKLLEVIKKKNRKGVALKPHQIQSHMFLFINCQIVNPAFTSQTKEQLTTKPSQFGSKFTVSDAFLSKIEKSPIIQNIMDFAERKADQILAKSDGSKRARMNNAKLTDANKAGTKDGWRCTLILTEGDSASGLALAGRAVADPDLIGVFPLRGKLLNVRDASIAQISNNQEIQNIKKFMGLQHKKEYTDTKSLRYGQLMIMTDQDHDGSHIKGLLVNFFEAHYPSLLKIPNFLSVFITPIVKVWKGDPKHPKAEKSFFTMPEYLNWKKEPGHQKGWDHKYYKGLGTSTNEDAEVYFRDPDKHLKLFRPMKEEEHALIDLAFSKKKADARKNWLREFVPGTYLDMSPKEITYDDFINKELILFSMADNLRSIPSVVDGLKPTQRKVLYTCFRRNMKKDMKVVELAGIVSGSTAYAYGDVSMQQTIVGLAQNFVGSNNVNLLEPSGNFGSRRMGGADAASARYIYTRPSPFARRIFHPADDALLTYDEDDGKQIEPTTYVPVVPLILLNGASGIGTGWSTNIPNYSPQDIVDNLKRRMRGTSKEDMLPMNPWFRDFKGEVESAGPDKFKFKGIIQQTGDNEVEITELPVRMWTQDFKDRLEEVIKAEKEPSWIKDYLEYNTPTTVHFVIKLDDKQMKATLEKGLEDRFKLSTTMSTSNMVAFDSQGRIQRYETVLDIMEEFYHVRLKFYEKRRQYLLDELNKQLDKLTNQARFIQMIIDGKLVVSKKKKSVLIDELKQLGFKPFPKVEDAKKAGEDEAYVENDESEDAEDDTAVGANDYDYLLGMPIWSLTQERVERIKKQIGDKEHEIDELIKLTPKDLWNKDLDDFLEEWNNQLEEEKSRKKKLRNTGRRASAKLGIGAGKAKKKARRGSDDDSDFEVGKKKSSALKAIQDRAKNRGGLWANFAANGPPQAVKDEPAQARVTEIVDDGDDFMDIDKVGAPKSAEKEHDSEVVAVKSKGQSADFKTKAKPAPRKAMHAESDDSDAFLAVAAEAAAKNSVARAVRATRPKSYVIDDNSDDAVSEADDKLGDISTFLKPIGQSTAGSGRTLFSATARPNSSQGLANPKGKTKSKSPVDSDGGVDDTDYAMLLKGSPRRPVAPPANDAFGVSEDDEDTLGLPACKPTMTKAKAPASKAAPAPKLVPKKPAAKKTAVSTAPKAIPLSPAAKAYAAKQAKGTASKPSTKGKATNLDDNDDEIEDIANDILSDEDVEVAPVKRPARRAAASRPKYTITADSSEDNESDEEYYDDNDDSD
ncbi:uncharacterized protein PV09_01622 [Verruconis gallopava]|uniref:DNA topoisomerase 2 n=1 Tax=Verruconis gallopava TaxID=253628 RepID=A0A0D1Z3X5_9PEZI|nr:uncharacterized protein PV09_01622 [Verruconis gallopava]KIW07682.1 hypothetical protein PV09_01622 [Verruconis gallopava]